MPTWLAQSAGHSSVTDLQLRIGFSILVGTAITLGVIIAVKEYYDARRVGRPLDGRNIRLSLSAIGPNFITYLFVAPYWALVYQFVAGSASQTLPINIATLALAFVACDLSYYVEHRCSHQVRFLWRLHHGTHHTGHVFDIPLAYRVNFINQFLSPVFYIPWLLLGLHPLVVLGFQLFVFHFQAWLHTESIGRLGFLDRVFNTPAIHRVHHSNAPAHRAVNLGGVFMIWDHLFRTYCPPIDKVSYGIADNPATRSYLGIYLDPWKSE